MIGLVYKEGPIFLKLSNSVKFREVGLPAESSKTRTIQGQKAPEGVAPRFMVEVQNLTLCGTDKARRGVYRPEKGGNIRVSSR